MKIEIEIDDSAACEVRIDGRTVHKDEFTQAVSQVLANLQPDLERYFEIVARSNLSGQEFVIETAPDLTLAQYRLQQSEKDWPTFKLSLREVTSECA